MEELLERFQARAWQPSWWGGWALDPDSRA
jgi:hypothetical protein